MWWGLYLESRIGRGLERIPCVRCDKRSGAAPRVSPPRPARRTRRVMVEGATPLFWTLVRHRGGGAGAPVGSHHLPSPLGGRSLHSDPCGKAEMLKTRTRIVLLNLALIAAGLRAWLSPWPAPGETALLDLVGAIDPLVQVPRPVVHQDTPSFEQVRAGIGRLHPVPDHMRQGRLDHLPGMVRLLSRGRWEIQRPRLAARGVLLKNPRPPAVSWL